MPAIDIFTTIVGILGSLTTVWVAHKTVFKPIYAWCRKVKSTFVGVSALPAKVDRIMNEVTPNGGGSIKDAVNRIEARQVVEETRQHTYISHSPIPFYETDAAGELTWVNRACERLMGVSSADLLGRGWINFVVADDRDRVIREWNQAIIDKRDWISEYRVIGANATIVQVKTEANVVRGGQGQPLGYVGSVQIPKETSKVG